MSDVSWYLPGDPMDPKKYLERAQVALRSRLGLPNPWHTRRLLGRDLTVRVGSLGDPATPDYDDAWIHACALHSTTVFDVGANVGQSALLILASQPALREIVLVEANWRALSIAADNLIRNQMSGRARFVCAFAGREEDRVVELWTVGTGAAGSMFKGHAVTAAAANETIQVPTVTLDGIAKRSGVQPDLVKIDVEGAEHEVLLGAREIAASHTARFIVEMHSPPELTMARNAELVLAWCRDVGYSAWYLDKAIGLDSPQQVASRGRCHLLLQPSSWALPEWLATIKQSAKLPE